MRGPGLEVGHRLLADRPDHPHAIGGRLLDLARRLLAGVGREDGGRLALLFEHRVNSRKPAARRLDRELELAVLADVFFGGLDVNHGTGEATGVRVGAAKDRAAEDEEQQEARTRNRIADDQ